MKSHTECLQYRRGSIELCGPKEAASLVGKQDTVCASMMNGIPLAFFDALLERARELPEIPVSIGTLARELELPTPGSGGLRLMDYFYSNIERESAKKGADVSYVPLHLSDVMEAVHDRENIVAVMQSSLPDKDGIVSLGPVPFEPGLLRRARLVLVQMSAKIPRIYGSDRLLSLDSVSGYYRLDESLPPFPPIAASAEELKIGEFIAERVPDGACIQLGIGSIGNAVGKCLTHKKDLGIHSEIFVESMVDLIECGAVNNSRKQCLPGKTAFGAVIPGKRPYEYLSENRDVEGRAFSWINDPRVISANKNVLSVNGAMQVDLMGQVYAESIGFAQFSGTGGQADFVRGARWSDGGMSFIALPSSRLGVDGKRISKLLLTAAPGSAVTTPRADVQYVVTEYGVADLRGKSLDARARALISIAHEDFRDELTHGAKKAGLII